MFSAVIGGLQLLAITFVFNYETPVTLKENGEWDKLTALMRRIYKPEAVQSRVLAIQVRNEGENDSGPSMLESFKDKNYRRASILGCMIMLLQQLSGINVLIFYSSTIFNSIQVPGVVGTAIVNSSNLVGAICGMLMLSCFGRKTMLVGWSFFMTACLFGMGWAYNEAYKLCPNRDDITNCKPPGEYGKYEVLFALGVVFFFELGYGVVAWLYLAEVMTNSGMSAAVVTS